jgi:hypothetical protein
MIETLHRLLAYLAVGAVGFGVVWALLLVARRRPAGRAFETFQAAVVSTLVVGAAAGLVLIVTGVGPREPVHLLYAAIAITAIPVARSFASRGGPRAQLMAIVAAFVVLGFIVYRLFATA